MKCFWTCKTCDGWVHATEAPGGCSRCHKEHPTWIGQSTRPMVAPNAGLSHAANMAGAERDLLSAAEGVELASRADFGGQLELYAARAMINAALEQLRVTQRRT